MQKVYELKLRCNGIVVLHEKNLDSHAGFAGSLGFTILKGKSYELALITYLKNLRFADRCRLPPRIYGDAE